MQSFLTFSRWWRIQTLLDLKFEEQRKKFNERLFNSNKTRSSPKSFVANTFLSFHRSLVVLTMKRLIKTQLQSIHNSPRREKSRIAKQSTMKLVANKKITHRERCAIADELHLFTPKNFMFRLNLNGAAVYVSSRADLHHTRLKTGTNFQKW